MKKSGLASAGLLAGLTLFAGPSALARAATAGPQASPSASLKAEQPLLNVGSTEELAFAAAHLPSGSAGYVQDHSSGSWKTVTRLGAKYSGTTGLRLTAIRTESLRLVYIHDGTPVAVSGTVKVQVIAKPYIALKGIATSISTGQAPTFKYTAENLATGAKAELERQFGTGGTWKSVATLKVAKLATMTAPKLTTLGKYAYRAVIVSGKTTQAVTAGVSVKAYGNVPLAPVCGGDSECTGTEQVGSQVFTYTDWAPADPYPSYEQNTTFGGGKTSCRSLSVEFAGDSYAQSGGNEAYLEFVQQSSDPVYASTPVGTVGSVTVALDGGPLYIDGSLANEESVVVLNITGSCYTVSGEA